MNFKYYFILEGLKTQVMRKEGFNNSTLKVRKFSFFIKKNIKYRVTFYKKSKVYIQAYKKLY